MQDFRVQYSVKIVFFGFTKETEVYLDYFPFSAGSEFQLSGA